MTRQRGADVEAVGDRLLSDANDHTPLIRNTDTTLSEQAIDNQGLSTVSFVLVQIAIYANVFLAGFDTTVTITAYATIGSEFHAVNLASWITISYMLTSTAMQPLYGRFCNIFGRRTCFLVASITFSLGCLGCGLSSNIIMLILMRALAGIGGGGFMTMATIINSDIVTPSKRGMYQAAQNLLLGFGAICGASFGGWICSVISWRFCFIFQTPISLLAIVIAQFPLGPIANKATADGTESRRSQMRDIDFPGAVLLILGLLGQVGSLSLGGNVLRWTDPVVVSVFIGSIIILSAFIWVEKRTSATPIIAVKILRDTRSRALLMSNFFLALVLSGLLFLMPLFFQAVLLDSPAQAGLRMVLRSLATPIGSFLAGIGMTRHFSLSMMTQVGMFTLAVGTASLLFIQVDSKELSMTLLMIPNFGAGVAFPSSLFQFINIFAKSDHTVATSTMYATRSVGSVWGVAVTSAIVQDGLTKMLPTVLKDKSPELADKIRGSMDVIIDLDPSIRIAVQQVFCDVILRAIAMMSVCATLGFLCSYIASRRVDERR